MILSVTGNSIQDKSCTFSKYEEVARVRARLLPGDSNIRWHGGGGKQKFNINLKDVEQNGDEDDLETRQS